MFNKDAAKTCLQFKVVEVVAKFEHLFCTNYKLISKIMTDKLPPEEDLKLENLNLAVEREEIYTRMDMLNKECTKFKTMFLKL